MHFKASAQKYACRKDKPEQVLALKKKFQTLLFIRESSYARIPGSALREGLLTLFFEGRIVGGWFGRTVGVASLVPKRAFGCVIVCLGA